ncbi:eCIS core domain-containing protein [Aureibacter tunicatorum]|uniref:eCIS core domain-containing protein n=1 Tax=Aureibacter tunicatorum TaxID=866807 RepID=A0AAE3XK45_9BACT|nr:DUF4157 domain-containing protein [Aureibacter tunicatorum]MDR6237458.1 hypothetical protein [Aureibacter tunicatorum]BDD06447.1 hypothetical protein AUTU_39300 [Aureibacter tunicatorum]
MDKTAHQFQQNNAAQLKADQRMKANWIAQQKKKDNTITSENSKFESNQLGIAQLSAEMTAATSSDQFLAWNTPPPQQPTQLQKNEGSENIASSAKHTNNTGLPDNLKSGIENLSGYSMSDVKVHYNSDKPAQLQAHAYAQGTDIHLASGQEKHLPHEAWHVVQQKQGRVKPTKQMKGKVNINDDNGLEKEADIMGAKALSIGQSNGDMPTQLKDNDTLEIIQRQFAPAITSSKAHLRNGGQWGNKIGNDINSGSEIVVDRNQQMTQNRGLLSNVTWTKAVNVTGANWNWANHNGANTYIRNSRIGNDKAYPLNADDSFKPNGRAKSPKPKYNWHHHVGEFIEIEESYTDPNSKIAYVNNILRRVNPQTGQVVNNLSADEQRQLDDNAMLTYLKSRVKSTLENAINGLPWQDQLTTDHNIDKIIMYDDSSKALRWQRFGATISGTKYVSYLKWLLANDGPFHRIGEGAVSVRNSLEYWRKSLLPPNGDGVTIKSISLSGSDLHDSGLGVMFVKFNKANAGGGADYHAAGDHEVVVKPENRDLEHKFFGTEENSLANTINETLELDNADKLATYKQKVHANFGSMCEKVIGSDPQKIEQNEKMGLTQAVKEALVFVLVTGLTDLHHENVLWDNNGKPYLIDADNALKMKYMNPQTASLQTGFSDYGITKEQQDNIYNGADDYESSFLQALKDPNSQPQRRLLLKVKQAFANSRGRTVPIETKAWGGRLKAFILTRELGQDTDTYQNDPVSTKWEYCDKFADSLPEGKGVEAPGLEGEVGIRNGTNGNFQHDTEKAQIFADLTVGQIPFYVYRYDNGHILHNDQVIWHGQTIDERMAGLFERFPNQVTN